MFAWSDVRWGKASRMWKASDEVMCGVLCAGEAEGVPGADA